MILEYCNSDIYFDIYHLKEKTRKRFSLVVVFFFLIRHPFVLLPFLKCLISKLKDCGKTKKK